jgi:hypothetical protein
MHDVFINQLEMIVDLMSMALHYNSALFLTNAVLCCIGLAAPV